MLNILIILLIVILINLVVIACLSIKVYSLEQNVKILNDAHFLIMLLNILKNHF